MTKRNTNACYLYSKANYAVRIKYDGGTLFVPAFASRFKIADESKLGPLPGTIRKVSIPTEQVKEKGAEEVKEKATSKNEVKSKKGEK